MFSKIANNNRILPALLAAAALAPAARGATAVWNGGAGDLTWDSATNWSSGALPVDIAQFQENGFNSGDTIRLTADQLVNRLAFNFSSTNAASKDLTLSGGTITLTGAITNNVGLNRQNTVSGVQTIESYLILGGSQSWTINGNSSAAGGVGRLVIRGTIGETPDDPKDITKSGNTNLELDGDNTYTGVTTINQNTIVLGHGNALGRGTSPVVVGNTAVNANQANLLTKGGLTFARDVFVRSGQTGGTRLGGADGVGVTTWTGTLSLNKDVSLTGGLGVPTGTVDFRGNLVDAADASNAFVSSNVTKINGGTVKLSGPANTYSGATTVTAGTLVVNGKLTANDALVTAADGTRLGGVGEIDRPVSVSPGGILSPGDAGPGTLTIGGRKSLTLGDGAVLEWQAGASPAASDRIDAAAVALGATPTLKILAGVASPDPSASYVLLSWGGDDPATLPDWSLDASTGFTGRVEYVGAADGLPGGQVVLSNVAAADAPEPAPVSLAPLAIALAGARRRRPS
jgi:autotransporter-associated beta strand protein